MTDHVNHFRIIFDIFREQQFYAKRSKCAFGASEVEYLGHIISQQGVQTNPQKIEAM